MVIGASAIVATALDEPEAPRSADIVLGGRAGFPGTEGSKRGA
jgi:hypothetical protein